jgi:hypothetical protein
MNRSSLPILDLKSFCVQNFDPLSIWTDLVDGLYHLNNLG